MVCHSIACVIPSYTREKLQSGDSGIVWNNLLCDEFRRSLIAKQIDLNFAYTKPFRNTMGYNSKRIGP